jgi:hypothetical protein
MESGFPHVLSQPDTYDGHTFPAGTAFHPNTWQILRDPTLYPLPSTFNPARWLDPSFPTYKSPLSTYPSLTNLPALFGYGRRQCPGLWIAERSLFIQAAYVGWGCTLSKKRDGEGGYVQVRDDDYTTGLGAAPRRWEFELHPRKGREKIVEIEAMKARESDPLVGRVEKSDGL